jgi:hypothetical protein
LMPVAKEPTYNVVPAPSSRRIRVRPIPYWFLGREQGVELECSDRLAGAPGLDGVVVCKMASRVAEHVKAARL